MRNIWWTVLPLLAAASALPSPGHAAPERVQYALIVSNNESTDPKVPRLQFADDDGAQYHALLAPQSREAVLLSVLDEPTQRRYPGLASQTRPPTHKELLAALARLNARMAEDRKAGREPVLFFIFTGHGQRGAAGEGSVSLLDQPFTRSDLFREVFEPSPAAFIHLIVDACDSYFFVNARGSLGTAPAYTELVTRYLDDRSLARFPQVGVILSTASQRESHEWSAISSGVFSHLVRSGLTGAADVNLDGKVEYSELRAFLASATAQVADPRGRPEIFSQPPARDRAVPLVDYTRRSGLAYLTLPRDLDGRYWVEDDRGIRIAELHKEREQPLVIALPPERTYFLRSPAKEARFNPSRPGMVVDAGALGWTTHGISARGSLDQAFQENLFSAAFGPKFYTGFVSSTGEVPVAPPAQADLSF